MAVKAAEAGPSVQVPRGQSGGNACVLALVGAALPLGAIWTATAENNSLSLSVSFSLSFSRLSNKQINLLTKSDTGSVLKQNKTYMLTTYF